ncbi:MAG: diaminopimelate decarboxylase [Gammaproteobacteria bacterium]|nr:diaminopimelate decarboxylase [Gammaproteobacteria bacterium]
MTSYHYQKHQLQMEQVSIKSIATQVQTPFYCYSQTAICNAYNSYVEQLTSMDTLICFAVKANSNQAILKTMADLGAGADVVSEGEMRRAIMAEIPASKIVYSGVAKTQSEMEYALSQNILQFNIESENELLLLSKVASSVNKVVKIAFRINPDVDAKTHAKISTGKSENKFGIPISKALAIYQLAAKLPGIQVQGVDVHIGSQLTQLEPFENCFILIKQLVEQLREDGHTISIVDVGGGLGIDYAEDDSEVPTIESYCALLKQQFSDLGCKLILEPGRSLVGNSGILVSKVIYLKEGEERTFVIIDAAMNDLLRPSMYDAFHNILPITETEEQACYDVVGPICETSDTFARTRIMSVINEGDLIAIDSAGAYGAVMSSTYNTRLQVPEVLVKDNQFSIIRERTDYEQLINQDQLTAWQ